MRVVQVAQSQLPRPAPRLEKKERDRKRTQQTKVADDGLEGFVDWVGVLANESVEEEEISMLVVGFSAWIRKWVSDLEDEPTPVLDGKRPKRSSPDEWVERD